MTTTEPSYMLNLSRRQWMTATVASLFMPLLPSMATQGHSIPGGVAQLSWRKQSEAVPTVKFGLAEPVVIDADDHWRIVIGISLETLPGQYLIYVKAGDSEEPAFTLEFEVLQKRYPLVAAEETENVAMLSMQKLSDLDFTNSVPPSLPLQLPIDAEWKDDFGQIIVAEDDSTVQKNYLELAAHDDATLVVQAPQNGIISRIQTDPENGISNIYIDHGRGLFSILYGVKDLTIELSNGVVAGAVLGKMESYKTSKSESTNAIANSVLTATVGQTANVQAARLRWQCVLNGVFVNPLVLTELS